MDQSGWFPLQQAGYINITLSFVITPQKCGHPHHWRPDVTLDGVVVQDDQPPDNVEQLWDLYQSSIRV